MRPVKGDFTCQAKQSAKCRFGVVTRSIVLKFFDDDVIWDV